MRRHGIDIGHHRIGLHLRPVGIRIRGATLHIDPCIPRDWPGFEATIVWRSARYRIVVGNPGRIGKGVASVRLDGVSVATGAIPLLDDGATHLVELTLGVASGVAEAA